MGTCACAFRPLFFFVCPQDPRGTTTHSLPNPQKNCFQNILRSGNSSPSTEFYFPQKGRSVSNSYFYTLLRYIWSKYVYGSLYFTYIRVLFVPYTLPNSQNYLPKNYLPFGQFHHYFFFFSYFYSFRYFIPHLYNFPYTFHKNTYRAKQKGGRGLYGNKKQPHKTESRARVRIP
jgi:hypothetical protein